MKTTKRSKMLLSSIAMLLVALVALGSATYAWYTMNASVSASTLTMSASAPEGLLIKDAVQDWTNELTWTDNAAERIPESITFTAPTDEMSAATEIITSQVKAIAAGNGNYAGEKDPEDPNNEKITVEAISGYDNILHKTFQVKSTGKTPLNDVVAKLIPGGQLAGTYINAVLVDFTAETVLDCVFSDGTQNGYLDASGAPKSWASSPYSSWTKGIQSGEINVATSAGQSYTQDSPHTLGLIVYVDGQNSNCTTNGAVTNAAKSVNFSVEFSSASIGHTSSSSSSSSSSGAGS